MKVRTHTSAYRRSCVVTEGNMKLRLIVAKDRGQHWAGLKSSEVTCYTTVWAEGLPADLIGLRRDGITIFGNSAFTNLFSSMPDKGMLKLKAMAMAKRLPTFPFSRQMTVQAYIDLVAKTKLDVANWARALKNEAV